MEWFPQKSIQHLGSHEMEWFPQKSIQHLGSHVMEFGFLKKVFKHLGL